MAKNKNNADVENGVWRSHAKINLTLDVLGKDRKTGYHRINTILHEIESLFDELTFETLKVSQGIILECNNPKVPLNAANTIVRAAALLHKKYEVPHGIKITLKKNIPLGSGLGGGASNAATALKALNHLWKLNVSREILFHHAKQIGMDVPFFILGGAALGMHYGEHLMPLPPLKTLDLKIINTGIHISTQDAYSQLDLTQCGKRHKDTLHLIKIMKGECDGAIPSFLHNDFEINFFKAHPELKIQYPMAHLTGSGGCLFRIFYTNSSSNGYQGSGWPLG